MYQIVNGAVRLAIFCVLAVGAAAQNSYQVVAVSDGGTIRGVVKWAGPQPQVATLPITKDPQICDPESHKKADLERLIVGPQGGVANTVVFLKNVSRGKAMDFPETRRFLNQKRCRYEPHILLVAKEAVLRMKSSDATLHTVHMEGAASFNLPFPFPNQIISRAMPQDGLITLKCNGGHVWMNAELFVVSHPYYAVTDETGQFELTDVPPGEYELVAWHEGWTVVRREGSLDVLTGARVSRPIFKEPRTLEKTVAVKSNETLQVNFVLSEK